jgi:hypothetical protein
MKLNFDDLIVEILLDREILDPFPTVTIVTVGVGDCVVVVPVTVADNDLLAEPHRPNMTANCE